MLYLWDRWSCGISINWNIREINNNYYYASSWNRLESAVQSHKIECQRILCKYKEDYVNTQCKSAWSKKKLQSLWASFSPENLRNRSGTHLPTTCLEIVSDYQRFFPGSPNFSSSQKKVKSKLTFGRFLPLLHCVKKFR